MQKTCLFIIVITLLIFCSVVLCEKYKNRWYKIKQAQGLFESITENDKADEKYVIRLQVPLILLSPVVMVFMTKEQYNLKTYNNSVEETSEVSDIDQNDASTKLISNDTKQEEEYEDIEINFRQALNRGAVKNSTLNITNKVVIDNSTDNIVLAEDNTDAPSTTTVDYNPQIDITTELMAADTVSSTGILQNNDSSMLADNNILLSEKLEVPVKEERWNNFTINANVTIYENTSNPASQNNIFSTENGTRSMKGPYSAALYNNAFIDQLSITTNSYTNEESPLPPPQDDRWRNFSSLRELMLSMSSGFRPLAGLYYDGYLDRPLIKVPGFVPYKKMYLY